eukprot:g32760.t1
MLRSGIFDLCACASCSSQTKSSLDICFCSLRLLAQAICPWDESCLPGPQSESLMIANSAAQIDDELDGNLDVDPDEITEVEVARQKIRQLMHEQERAADYEDRLARKLQKLDADLASKREEVEGLQRRNGQVSEYLSEKRERETKAKTQEERIREYLTEVLYAKPKQKDKKAEFNLDTVQSGLQGGLRNDYSPAAEQCLQVLGCQLRALHLADNGQQQMPGRLSNTSSPRESTEPPSEEELKAIQPKTKKRAGRSKSGKPRYNAEGVEQIQKFGDNYANQLKKILSCQLQRVRI